jgi:hypothetical protein
MTLEEELKAAIQREDYEAAAILRDRIQWAGGGAPANRSLYTEGIFSQMANTPPVRFDFSGKPNPPNGPIAFGDNTFMDMIWAKFEADTKALGHLSAYSERQKALNAAHEEAWFAHVRALAASEQERLLVAIQRRERQVEEEFLRRINVGSKKKLSAHTVAKESVRITDHRDNSMTFIFRGQVILRVKHTIKGMEFSPAETPSE